MRMEAGFTLQDAMKLHRRIGELLGGLFSQGWLWQDIQRMIEVPVAGRAALQASRDWAYTIVIKALSKVLHGEMTRLPHNEILRQLSNWEMRVGLSMSLGPDCGGLSPYTSQHLYYTQEYRANCLAIRISDRPPWLPYVIVACLNHITEDGTGEYSWDLYSHNGTILVAQGIQKTPQEMAKAIQEVIHALEK